MTGDAAPLPGLSAATRRARDQLMALGQRYHQAGWLLGTSGNLSARVTTPEGERVVVTASGRDKGHLGPEDFVELDLDGTLLAAGEDDTSSDPLRDPSGARPRPSAEATIHLALYRTRPAARVTLHVHTVASTLATPEPASATPQPGTLTFEGIELIKGWDLWDEHAIARLPVFPNWPEVPKIARDIERFYESTGADEVPALLIAGHGITAWGSDAFTANRHLEVTEFLCRIALARR